MVRFEEIPEYRAFDDHGPAQGASRRVSCCARCGTWVPGSKPFGRCSDCLATLLVYGGILAAGAIACAAR